MRTMLLTATALVLALAAPTVQAGDVAAGETRYLVNCVNCHGKTGKGLASFPALTGRDADYIAQRLSQYRAKEQVGPNSAIMMSLVGDLTDDEISNIAAYVAETFQ
ncbi:MAG: c-type cytochrome [Pseudomonadota bacterium]